MSLLLRKGCQDSLDAAGLGVYHVEITNNNYLGLVGECGQPLVTIHGIKFNRSTPSVAEIEYAVELFEAFLVKHKTNIMKYLKATQAFKLKDEITLPDSLSETSYRNEFSYKQGDFKVEFQFTKSKGIENIEIKSKSKVPITITEATKMKINKKLLEANIKAIKDRLVYRELEQKVADMYSELSKCEI